MRKRMRRWEEEEEELSCHVLENERRGRGRRGRGGREGERGKHRSGMATEEKRRRIGKIR